MIIFEDVFVPDERVFFIEQNKNLAKKIAGIK